MLAHLTSCFLFCTTIIYASLIDPAPEFYKDIQDICNPTQQELSILQDKLLYTNRPILERMKETGFIPREFRFLSTDPTESPESGSLFLRSSPDDRENCIILYASFNERYPLGVKRLLDCISTSDYEGHVYYQIGGWPNIKAGDLCLAHVPFAFKACFLKEMQAKGYKKVLWLDASLLPSPSVSLNTIFDMIGRIGFLIQAGDHSIGNYMNEDAAEAFGMTLEESKPILSCSAAFIGVDFTNSRGVALIDAWYAAAHHPFAYFSDRSDQNALSILIYQMGLTEDLLPRKLLGSIQQPYGNIILMDRSYVKDERTY